MTLIPPGAHLAPVDLPPPPPEADPREPSPSVRRGTRTPQKARSPAHSRSASPTRPLLPHPTSSDATSPTLHQPMPTASPVPIHFPHHLSRPSSPASIHSSSSAIFERDIELPAVASLSLNTTPQQGLNHKSSRLHMTHGSALDHTVPAVLDDAVEALANSKDDLEIEAPAVGMARQSSAIGSRKALSHSRSPSPISSRVSSPAQSPPILGQLTTQLATQAATQHATQAASPTRPAAPNRLSTGPHLPGAWSWQDAPIEEIPAIPSHLTPTKDKRRISFISYNDLLLSVPTTVTPLGDITSGNLSPEHLPGTISPNTRSPVLPSAGPADHKPRPAGLGLGEGEWSREGLGKGLEQRLEDLVQTDSNGSG
ncbi:hypothetical protein BCR39DRAFT_555005 [Naematelia encephala]|uniref:Uncharacterized protein n=1 Tax=Naematelia encephala TaxID=71784 RepID=A0A1Y2ADX8_9TREE|nr:hypothetical protein BCR39DRAFT_555005 [Naematelia encephala]